MISLSVEFEKLASGHDVRAALNERLAHANNLKDAERELYAEVSKLHSSLAAKYRALSSLSDT